MFKRLLCILFISLSLLFTSCTYAIKSDTPLINSKEIPALNYASKNLWFMNENAFKKADILYFVSTNVKNSKVKNGGLTYNSDLSKEDISLIKREMEFINKEFGEKYNIYSPFYRQATLDSFLLCTKQTPILNIAFEDIKEAFLYYLKNFNKGKPFFIIAFSQGSILATRLFKELPKEYFLNLKGAYLMGYGLTKEDIEMMNIKPMENNTEGIIAAFNSSTSPNITWDILTKDRISTINPINWRKDSSKANFEYKQKKLTVYLDKSSQMLIVQGLSKEEEKSPLPLYYNDGFLHHLDIKLYNASILKNIEDRLKSR